MPPTVDGRMVVANYSANSLNINIYVNTPGPASKEWITAIILHEIVHAIYTYNNGAPTTAVADHNKMNNYLATMDAALREQFPSLSAADARSLNLTGLEKTIFGAALRDVLPEITNSNWEIMNQYRWGNKGTKCR